MSTVRRNRGEELKRRIREIIKEEDDRYPKAAPEPRPARRSILQHHNSGCSAFFHHPHLFHTSGLRVASHVHSAAVARTCTELCVDTLNDMKHKGAFITTSDYIRFVEFSVVRGKNGTFGAVSVHGSRPYMSPNDVKHAVVRSRTPRLGLPINDLLSGKVSTIPIFLFVRVMNHNKWDLVDNVTSLTGHTRLNKQEYPSIAAAFGRGRLLLGDNGHYMEIDGGDSEMEVPVYGARAWMEHGGHRWAMTLDNRYVHGIALILTSDGSGMLIDSNTARPTYVDETIRSWVESIGFRYDVARLPETNLEDADEIKDTLSRLNIETPMTITGYCASLTLCYLIDVICTGNYTPDHLVRFINDIVPPHATGTLALTCIVLYTRAVMNDLIKICLMRMRSGIQTPEKWPPSVPISSDHATVNVTWRDLVRVSHTS